MIASVESENAESESKNKSKDDCATEVSTIHAFIVPHTSGGNCHQKDDGVKPRVGLQRFMVAQCFV